MRHVREEPRLQLVGAAQVIGAFVELRIQRDDAAVRVLELAVDALQLLLPRPQLVERAQQLLILLLHLLDRPSGRLGKELSGQSIEPLRRQQRRAPREHLLDTNRRAVRPRLDVERIHQPPGADQTETHAGWRSILPRQHGVDVGKAWTLVRYTYRQVPAERSRPFDEILDHSAAGVLEGVSRELRDGSRDARLFRRIECRAQRQSGARGVAPRRCRARDGSGPTADGRSRL